MSSITSQISVFEYSRKTQKSKYLENSVLFTPQIKNKFIIHYGLNDSKKGFIEEETFRGIGLMSSKNQSLVKILGNIFTQGKRYDINASISIMKL